MNARVCPVLYGDDDSVGGGNGDRGFKTQRWHYGFSARREHRKALDASYDLDAFEVWETRLSAIEPLSYLLVHVSWSSADAFADFVNDVSTTRTVNGVEETHFSALVRRTIQLTEGISFLSGSLHWKRGGKREFSSVFIDGDNHDEVIEQMPAESDRESHLLWTAASLTPSGQFKRHSDDKALDANTVRLSASWSALTLRDGTGFLWHSDSDEPFREEAETLAVSIYSDMLLLAHAQRTLLDEIADQFAHIDPWAKTWKEVADVERRFTEFRNRLWWPDVSPSRHATMLLQETQGQLNSPVLFSRLVEDLRDFHYAVSANELADIRENQEILGRQQRRFEAQAKLVGSVAIALGLLLTFLGLNINNLDRFGWRSDSVDGLRVELVLVLMLGTVILVGGLTAYLIRKTRHPNPPNRHLLHQSRRTTDVKRDLSS